MASKTEITNMALSRFGGRRIDDYADTTDTSLEAVYARLFFDQTAKALLKDHWWPFAKEQAQLSQSATAPTFQWDHAYILPADFLRVMWVYDGSDNTTGITESDYEIQGSLLLSDEDEIYLKYIKWVTDTGAWDALFTEVFVLTLARKLCIPLSQDTKIKADIDKDMAILLRQVRAMDRQEGYFIGRESLRTWREARLTDTA